MIPWDEKMAAMVSTAASLVLALLAAVSCMINGIGVTALYAGVVIVVFAAFRWVIGRSLRAMVTRPAPAPAPDPAPAGDLDPVE